MSVAALAGVAAAICAALAAAALDQVIAGARTEPGSQAHAGAPATGVRTGGASLRAAWQAVRRLVDGRPVVQHAAAGVAAGTFGQQAGGPAAGLVLVGVGAAASVGHGRRALRRTRHRRERAAPALARTMADALRGGLSIRSALAAGGTDRAVGEPLRVRVAATAATVERGAPLPAALLELSSCGGPCLRLTCGTVAMHLEAGGALASELDRLATDGEAALRIEEDRIAATAQARATVRVVAALPVLALLAAEAVSGDFVQTIAGHPVALALLILGFALEAAAMLAARMIVGAGR